MKKLVLILCIAILILLTSIWFDNDKESVHNTNNENSKLPSVLQGKVSSMLSSEPITQPIFFKLNDLTAYPGDCLCLYIANASNEEQFSVDVPFYDKTLTYFPYNEGYIGIIPIYAWLTAGKYQITTTDLLSQSTSTIDIEILPKTFDVQYLKVKESTAAVYTDDNAAKDQVYFDAARANPILEKLWEGSFIQPAEGEITTDYNATRYTNDNPTPSRHLAIDIANSEGTTIKASNSGKVVLARELIVTGNSVVIDHGMGIFTSSFHMNEIDVEEGTYVTKGDPIGKMGSTGYSTGSHLHFAIWKEGTFLNPWYFFENDPVKFK